MRSSISILTINAGSSSIKTAVYELSSSEQPKQQFSVAIESVGQGEATLSWQLSGDMLHTEKSSVHDMHQARALLMQKLRDFLGSKPLHAIGHRIVHGGMELHQPTRINAEVIAQLHTVAAYDPEHAPSSLALIEACEQSFPDCPQIACFDSGFFHQLPRLASMLPLPRKYYDEGVRKYGFHGLSYRSVLKQLQSVHGHDRFQKVIIAHLGSGASLAAMSQGKPIDTTMSFTPVSGIPMSTRSGDLDPSIFPYLHRRHGMDSAQFEKLIHEESGLLGVSELSADMHTLLEQAPGNAQAAEAIDMFCYQVRKAIGALSAAMGGVDCLVFTGGIGQKSAIIRKKICTPLAFIGVELDEHANHSGAEKISDPLAGCAVYVIPADESSVIVQDVMKVLKD